MFANTIQQERQNKDFFFYGDNNFFAINLFFALKRLNLLMIIAKCEAYKISTVLCENMSNGAADTF